MQLAHTLLFIYLFILAQNNFLGVYFLFPLYLRTETFYYLYKHLVLCSAPTSWLVHPGSCRTVANDLSAWFAALRTSLAFILCFHLPFWASPLKSLPSIAKIVCSQLNPTALAETALPLRFLISHDDAIILLVCLPYLFNVDIFWSLASFT